MYYYNRKYWWDILLYHLKKSCSLDNCPRNNNQNQDDENSNGIGNVCEQTIITTTLTTRNISWYNILTGIQNQDSDWDGIIGSSDLCPTVKENYNGYQDTDRKSVV